MGFADNLKTYREAKHWSQRKLALQVGLSHGLIALYEQGKRIPSFDSLCLLADTLGVTLTDLVSNDEPTLIAEEQMAEQRMLRAWREADPTYRQVVLEILESHRAI